MHSAVVPRAWHPTFRVQLLLGFGAVLLISVVMSGLAYRNILGYRGASVWVRHTQQVIANAETAHRTVQSLDDSYGDYLLTGGEDALASYQENIQLYHEQLDALSTLTADNPPQAARWQAIKVWLDELRTEQMEPGIAARQRLPSGVAPDSVVVGFNSSGDRKRGLSEISAAFDQGVGLEQQLLEERTQAVGTSSVLLLNVLLGGTVVTVALGLGIALLVSHYLGAGMDRLAQGAQAVAEGDLSRRIQLRRDDEIGKVAAAFDRMAEALQQDRAEREAVERLKDEFVSVVSHELRTPLTSIRGSLGLLHAGLLGPISTKAQRMLDVALSNTDRLIRLINDILDIERMRSGRVPLYLEPANASDLVRRSVESLRGLAHGARVELVANEVAPLDVLADADRIVQTLTNLIGNAIKFSPPDSRIEIAAREASGEALFSVTDHGRGIPPQKLETIFGRFEQVDQSDARDKGGSGLGLAISRGIVELHGGRVWVESVVDQGSTFYFTLPLATPTRPTVCGASTLSSIQQF